MEEARKRERLRREAARKEAARQKAEAVEAKRRNKHAFQKEDITQDEEIQWGPITWKEGDDLPDLEVLFG